MNRRIPDFVLRRLGLSVLQLDIFLEFLHDVDSGVQLAPAVVILRRHIEERLVIEDDADDRLAAETVSGSALGADKSSLA